MLRKVILIIRASIRKQIFSNFEICELNLLCKDLIHKNFTQLVKYA